jgi:hypothetical protein
MQIGQFTATTAGLQRITLGASSFDWATVSEDCTNLRAVQNGQQVPIYVLPGASAAATTATVFVRTLAAGTVGIYAEAGAGRYVGKTRRPRNLPLLYTDAALSCIHSLAQAEGFATLDKVTHPSVTYIAAGLSSKTYWLAATPFNQPGASSGSDYEDPCIWNSTDGATWTAQPVYVDSRNLGTYPKAIDNAAWNKVSHTITPDYGEAPDGTMTADRIQATGLGPVRQLIAVTPGRQYVFAFWVKRLAGGCSYSVYNVTASANIIATTSYTAQATLNTWVLIEVPFTAPAGCENAYVYINRDVTDADLLAWNARTFERCSNLVSRSGAGAWHSDNELVFDAGRLWCFYRDSTGGQSIIRYQTSTNGKEWTEKATATLDGEPWAATGTGSLLSPAIIKVGETWAMYVTEQTGAEMDVDRYTSTNLIDWTFAGRLARWWPDHYQGPWHHGIQLDPDSGLYLHLGNYSLDGSNAPNTASHVIMLSHSPDGINWTFDPAAIFADRAANTTGTVSTQGSYRPSFCRTGTNEWFLMLSDTGSRCYYGSTATDWRERAISGCSATFCGASSDWSIEGVADTLPWTIYGGTVAVNPAGRLQLTRSGNVNGSIFHAADVGNVTPRSWRTRARFRLKTLTSAAVFSWCYPNQIGGLDGGFFWNYTTGKVQATRVAALADAGVDKAADLDWHNIELVRTGEALTIAIDGVAVHAFTATGLPVTPHMIMGGGTTNGDGIELEYAAYVIADAPEPVVATAIDAAVAAQLAADAAATLAASWVGETHLGVSSTAKVGNQIIRNPEE